MCDLNDLKDLADDDVRKQRRGREIHFRDAVFKTNLEREKQDAESIPRVGLRSFDHVLAQNGRTTLLDWMMTTCENYQLRSTVMFLAINYLERILLQHRLPLATAQHMAAVCIALAVKLEHNGGYAMGTLHIIEDVKEYVEDDFLNMELFALRSLQWNLIVPTSYTFLSSFADRWWLPQHVLQRAFHHLKGLLLRK